MKKLFLISLIAVLAVGFSGCIKEKKGAPLAGTWIATGTFTLSDRSYDWTATIRIDTSSTGHFYYEDTDHDVDRDAPFTYVYEPPTFTFTMNGTTLNGNVNDNVLTINNLIIAETRFYRQ